MDKPNIRSPKGPEAKIRDDLIRFLKLRDWFVKILHGNIYQVGMPDLFICQRRYGWRWVEVKQSTGYMFTPAQGETFPKLQAADVGIWVLTAATEQEYAKLWKQPNWWQYFTANHIRVRKEPRLEPPEAKGPEAEIQRAVIKRLEREGWFVKVLHGDLYQSGMPDLFACRKDVRWRFIECKNPKKYRFTGAQLEVFPRLQAEGVGVWILTSDSDSEINKLFAPPNWHEYLKGAS